MGPMPKQSHRASVIEAISSTLIGYLVALAGQLIVFPLFDIHVSLASNLAIGAVFMGISTARSYLIRRLFEWLRVSGALA
jgi:hypothetical protein